MDDRSKARMGAKDETCDSGFGVKMKWPTRG